MLGIAYELRCTTEHPELILKKDGLGGRKQTLEPPLLPGR